MSVKLKDNDKDEPKGKSKQTMAGEHTIQWKIQYVQGHNHHDQNINV